MKDAQGQWEAFDDYVLDFALERLSLGEKLALVTLVKIEGSSPRFSGAQMAVSETGSWVGYLSGGCIERAVVAEALAAIEAGESRLIRYGQGSKYFDIQLPCGSAIELFFDVGVDFKSLAEIDDRLTRRQPAEMVIDQNCRFGVELRRPYLPRKRLVIAGVGPSVVQLGKMAVVAGYEVAAWSYDESTLRCLQPANVKTIHLATSRSLPTFEADSRTAVVCMFHDHDWDIALLPTILATDAYYIGAVGSRATHADRVKHLMAAGVTDTDIGRIRAPAGLFGGNKSAGDIALSVLAEIMQVWEAQKKDRGKEQCEAKQTGFAASRDLTPMSSGERR